EAYVTFLSSGPDPEYFTSVRLQLFAIKHDPLTLDPIPRDVVILTYPSVPKHQREQLSNEGAIIIPVEEITSIPNPWKDTDDHWRDVLGKLYVFNMTQYSRVMMLDGDMFLHKSLSGIWQDEHSWPKSGLAACGDGFAGHEIPQRNDPPFNSGFMMVVPDENTFKELLEFRDYDHSWMDQAMLNSYFDQNGLHPWEPLDHKWVCNAPTMADIEFGIAVLHEKLWSLKYRHDNPPELMEMWQRRVGRMEGYW
ncbi:hypothetical protein TREMEDRAFT_17181, partial [Tremella mesenterica DSM 1558]|uniref:uncharacterized protein n=1 Tax=Tremella mesenterica (strain ATCC 24925 / CBS 8224 / DSM 1558 / NBRC 9311 / NRRL Y-6157 / RJB 2259-6 / UBC 559-6) TaxID=578456 RepID=UPI0003F4978F